MALNLCFVIFCTLEIYSLALNLSIMSYQFCLLSNSQRLKDCCTLVATQRVMYLDTQLMFWYFCTLEIYSLAHNLSIMRYQLGLLSNPQRLKVCCTLVATYKVTYLGTQLMFWYFFTLEVSPRRTQPEYHELSGWSPE